VIRLVERLSQRVSIKLALLLCVSLGLAACGKVGDPLPPVPKAPLIVNELNAIQRGTSIVLTFPLTRTPRSSRLAQISIYRLIEPADAPLGLSPESFDSRSTIIYQMPGDAISAGTSVISYEDPIALIQQGPSRLRYAVRLVTRNGVAADLSNYAVITPVTAIAKPPANVRAAVTQNDISVTWSAPAANELGDAAANVAGYNIYRKSDSGLVKLNPQPLAETTYSDRTFAFGTRYEYLVRALSLLPGETLATAIESNDSETAGVVPKDTFPPVAPESIKIASINGIVSMFWPSNPEPDLAGYLLYRSEDGNAPPERWLKLTPRVHTPTTFRDEKVIVGKTYYYQISAIDSSGNEGPRSVAVAETVNP
jgi:hypothetical protein